VEVVEGGPQADIALDAGGQTRTGRGVAESPFEAVALAVLDAPPSVALLGATLALGGSFAWEYIWVEAGQSVPLS